MNTQRQAGGAKGSGHFRSSRSFVATGAAIVLLIVATASFAIWSARDHAFTESQESATNLAVVLAEQTARYVQVVDLAMIAVQSEITELNDRTYPQFKAQIQSDTTHRFLVAQMVNVPQAGAIALVGVDGEILNSSRPGLPSGLSFADRDFFQFLQHHDDPAIFVGAPNISRMTGKRSLYFARRINGPDGSFLALVVGVVDATYLNNFYESIRTDRRTSISVLHRDGTILVRYPDPGGLTGRQLPSSSPWYDLVAQGGGHYWTLGLINGLVGVVTVHPLHDYPLVVDVQQPDWVILAGWHDQAIYIIIVASLAAIGFIILTRVIVVQFGRQQDQNVKLELTAEALRDTEQRLRAFADMSSDWSWEQDADLRFPRPSNIPLTTLPTDVGKLRWELADPAMNPHRWNVHKADLAARRAFRDFRWERIQVDGKRRYMSTSGNPIFDEAGAFTGYHGTGRDITADVQAAEELRIAKEQSEAANRANADLVTAVYFANDAIIGLAPDGIIRTWNPAAERLYGLAEEQVIGLNIGILWPEDKQSNIAAHLRAVGNGEVITSLQTSRLKADGRVAHISVSAAPVTASGGEVTALIVTARDVSGRVRAETALRLSQEHIASVFRNASVGLNQSDATGRYNLVNDRFCEIVGRTREELLALSYRDISHPEDTQAFASLLEQLGEIGTGLVIEKRYIRPGGSYVWVRNSLSPARDQQGTIVGVVAVVEDITERKDAGDRIRHLAYHDALTGLANRTQLTDRLAQALAGAAHDRGSFAVLALDLDRFKVVNDTLGHDAGDQLLAEVANRLRSTVRSTDTVARVGGDELVVIQTGVAQPAGATELSRRLIEHLAEPFDIAGRQVTVGVSVGIAVYPGDGMTSVTLLQNADVALYQAKKSGRGGFRFFDATEDFCLSHQHTLAIDLRRAIETNALRLHFQPLFTCATRALMGFEALLRWQHPLLGPIAPLDIVLVAEESGLIQSLGLWILEEACSRAALWAEPLRVAVNLSTAQFRDSMLADRIVEILHRTGLPAARLELEVTETLYIDNIDRALGTLRALKGAGVKIALDDFGTGYSSLSYLRSFPFDKIKIDRSFVQALTVDASALPLVQAILAMGHNLNLCVTAEGVETEQQLELLRQESCDEVQGFLLGRPMPQEDVDDCIHMNRRQQVPSLVAEAG
ncbi:MAG: putative diguanylate cyclase (GGDEF)/phosphodiesterase with and two sensor [Rhodopila sp.]|nr:putative diguanylate cyclase (GGDEF)/phosphodiesterase with and two sensor [Rhodopila sp.]